MKLISVNILVIIGIALIIPTNILAANLPTVKTLENRLQDEVEKMIQAGHLRPAYTLSTEHYRFTADPGRNNTNNFDDVWHNPAETIYTLLRALPHLPNTPYPHDPTKTWKQKAREYLQSEYNTYRPYEWSHMGSQGNHREINDIPEYYRNPSGPGYGDGYRIVTNPGNPQWTGWTFNPYNFYALWKYAIEFNNATTVLSQLAGKQPGALPADDFIKHRPHVLNSYIAGYYGFLELQKLAGQTPSSSIQSRLDTALSKRITFMLDPHPKDLRALEAGGFLWLVPELGDYLFAHAYSSVNQVVNDYADVAPYWMVARADEVPRVNILGDGQLFNEGSISHVYDYYSLFSAKAFALKYNRQQLEQYLDVPFVPRGDLYYIQNLVAAIEAPTDGSPSPTPHPADPNRDGIVNIFDLNQVIYRFSTLGLSVYQTVIQYFGKVL